MYDMWESSKADTRSNWRSWTFSHSEEEWFITRDCTTTKSPLHLNIRTWCFQDYMVQRGAPLLNNCPTQYLCPGWCWIQSAPECGLDTICWPTKDIESILDSKLWHMPWFEGTLMTVAATNHALQMTLRVFATDGFMRYLSKVSTKLCIPCS